MRRLLSIALLSIAVASLASVAPGGQGGRGEGLPARVQRALEAGDPASLARLFPDDRKVRVSFDTIANLKGYVGAGPIVEALRRYLSGKNDVRFETEPAEGAGEGATSVRVKGSLISRDPSGRRERVGLLLAFSRIDGEWLAMEIQETG